MKGYTFEEVVGFSTDYLANQQPIGLPRSRHEGRLGGLGLMGLEVTCPTSDIFDATHLNALYHTSEVYPFVQQHINILLKNFPNASDEVIQEKHITTFKQWLQEELANGSKEDDLTWCPEVHRIPCLNFKHTT